MDKELQQTILNMISAKIAEITRPLDKRMLNLTRKISALEAIVGDGLTDNPIDKLTPEEMEYIKHGKKIDAIKSVRYRLRLDLHMAKAFIEKYWRL